MANLHPWPAIGRTIDFIQHVRSDPSTVWEAITTEKGLQKWFHVTTASIPNNPGNEYSLGWISRGRASGQNMRIQKGKVVKYEKPLLLALEWWLPFSNQVTHLSIQIQQSFALFGENRDKECDIWLIHSGFPNAGIGLFEFDGYHRHWRQDIGALVALLENRPGKPTPYALAGIQFVGGADGVGLLVSDVFTGSPAARAGIKGGDIIRSVDGIRLSSLDDFHDWIDAKLPGESGIFDLGNRQVKVQVESVQEAQSRFLILKGENYEPRFDLSKRQDNQQKKL